MFLINTSISPISFKINKTIIKSKYFVINIELKIDINYSIDILK